MLVGLAAETGETAYLLSERDARFAAEDAPLLEHAAYAGLGGELRSPQAVPLRVSATA
jgi:hypothetical protein